MQTSTRNREPDPSYLGRIGHLQQLSITDDNHHVTEAIGYMYGDSDNDPRRVSNTSSAYRSSYGSDQSSGDGEELINPRRMSYQRKPLSDTFMNGLSHERDAHTRPEVPRTFSWENNANSNRNTQLPLMDSRQRSPSVTATSQFPLNDIDYESSPAAVAKELSNLQALRRMSMNVHAPGDPDLPSIDPASMPNAPSHGSSPDDSSRLFWVPARLHPELAPKEFKSFLESKAEQIKRRSGELSTPQMQSFSRSSGLSSSSSNSSNMQRRKSMLSRQIDGPSGYQDGADRLERKRSLSGQNEPHDPNLAELEFLVNEGMGGYRPDSPEAGGDIILPSLPSASLKRSTRTKYRRGGSLRKGDRSFAERAAKRSGTESPPPLQNLSDDTPPVPNFSSPSDFRNLAETLRDPSSQNAPLHFARPAAKQSSSRNEAMSSAHLATTYDMSLDRADGNRGNISSMSELTRSRTQESTTRIMPEMTRSRTHESYSSNQSIPQIVETPPVDEYYDRSLPVNHTPPPSEYPAVQPPLRHPERTSSRENSIKAVQAARPTIPRSQSSSIPTISPAGMTQTQQSTAPAVLPPPSRQSRAGMPPMNQPKQSLDQPSPLPGNDNNTSNLSYIPTLTADKQSQERKESKKSGWGWLLGKDEKDKEQNRKIAKSPQSHDNTRLDLLQTSIDGNSKRRETIELDRDSMRLEEERKKESQRKASGSEKKEKKGLFSSIFGGEKSKAEKEAKKVQRGLSPEPPYRELKADIDYSWTRFTILEERAIYRMAHIKLANPRRPLYSQVLLSNFMYSYLAKVQQMHPQMNLPTSAKQQKKQKELQQQQQQQQSQPEEFTQYQRYQQQQTGQQQPQTYSSLQGYEGDPSMTSGYEQNNPHQGIVGNNDMMNNGQYGYNGNVYYHQQHHQQNPDYENDRDDEMW